MEARKQNKVYQIDQSQAAEYAAAGYDIYDGGKLKKHAANKTVPIAEYEKLKAELEALKSKKKDKEA